MPKRCRAKSTTIAVALLGAAIASADVPPPLETPARVTVSGRTSTVRDIAVVKVDEQIPETFSGRHVKNTPGFTWYVSQHFALKTDYPGPRARHYLTLLELAYPHYVELFGREPAGIASKRMTVVCASSRQRLKDAMASDGMSWNAPHGGGGITYEGRNVAYQADEGAFQYFKRYVLLHEATHLFQICLSGALHTTPGWWFEGVADSLSHHVYEEAEKRLTVHVIDKMTNINYYDGGIAEFRKDGITVQTARKGQGGRGASFMLVTYLSTDAGLAQKMRIWRDELLRLGLRGHERDQASDRLFLGLFGSWDRISAGLKAWAEQRRNTFHYVDWGWEQDGNTLWSYGFPLVGEFAQTDLLMPPGERPEYDPLRMDYPARPMPPIVGPVERGAEEPAVGCVVDFSRCPNRGLAGIGLGVVYARALPFADGFLFRDEAGETKGLEVAAYRLGKVSGNGQKSEEVRNGELLGRGTAAGIALRENGSAPVGPDGVRENYVAEWRGWLRIAEPGVHWFATASDDGSWMWIDGEEVVSNGGYHGVVVKVGAKKLEAGMHRLRVRHLQGGGGAGMIAGTVPEHERQPGFLKLLVEKSRNLILDGTDLGMEEKSIPLPQELRQAMAEGGHRIGITARIASTELRVTLRARGKGARDPSEFNATVPLTPQVRQRLMDRPATLLARDGWHGLTPFFDDCRRLEPDLSVPAPPNRWRNPADQQLFGLTKALWILGDHAPMSLRQLWDALVASAPGEPAVQRAALNSFNERVVGLIREVRSCKASPGDRERAVAALAGLSLEIEVGRDATAGHARMVASLRGPHLGRAEGTLRFSAAPEKALTVSPEPEPVRLDAAEQRAFTRVYRLSEGDFPFTLQATAELVWRGEKLRLTSFAVCRPSIPHWWVIGPFDNPGGPEADVLHPVEVEKIDFRRKHTGLGGKAIAWRRAESKGRSDDLAAESYVDLAGLYGEKSSTAAYAFVWLEAPEEQDAVLALGTDDGNVVWLNGKRVHTNLVARGYRSRSDLVPIHLKQGRNALLIKVTQAGGPWGLCARLESQDGRTLPSVVPAMESK